MLVEHFVPCPLGLLRLRSDGAALVGLYLPGHRRTLAPVGAGEDAVTRHAARWLAAYFAGDPAPYDGPLRLTGTPFQQKVWALLREIPRGETRSYGRLAAHLGQPGASRAVGAANGQNPVSIIVPCHRVVGASGKLIGYAGGEEAKRFLLGLESGPER